MPYKTRYKTGQSWCKSSCHDVESEFFATKAPDPPHWTLNSHFGAFRTIRVHLGPFGCLTRLSAKRVKLVQKFMPQSRVRIFWNIPDPPHWTQNSYFCAFHTSLVQLGLFGWLAKLDGKWAELMRKFVPRSGIGTFRNERTRSTPLDPKLILLCVSYYFSVVGTVWLARKT